MSGGVLNDSQDIAYLIPDEIAYAGLLVTYGTDGAWDLCGAGEEPLGFTLKTSRDPRYIETTTLTSSISMDIHALIEGQEVELRYTSTAPAAGELVETDANGVVSVNSGAGWIVGMCLGQAADSWVRVRVSKRYKSS